LPGNGALKEADAGAMEATGQGQAQRCADSSVKRVWPGKT